MQGSLTGGLILVIGSLTCFACQTVKDQSVNGLYIAGRDVVAAPVVAPNATAPDQTKKSAAATDSKQKKLRGFDFTGQIYCWSLLDVYDCIERVDPVALACADMKGQVTLCDDCRRLCSVKLQSVAVP